MDAQNKLTAKINSLNYLQKCHFINEIDRILDLPIEIGLDDKELQEYSRMNILEKAYKEGFRLFKPQAEAVCAYELYGGNFSPVGVGWGKTLISLMIADKAYRKGLTKMVLFIPKPVVLQLMTVDIAWARKKVPIGYDIFCLANKGIEYRRALCSSDRKGLYIIPYSCLSTRDAIDNLNDISPQLVIADEGHYLARKNAARTSRLLNYLNDNYYTEVVVLSGTITKKSLLDYYHLINFALKHKSPLPTEKHVLNSWAEVLDSSAVDIYNESLQGADVSTISPLLQWANSVDYSKGKYTSTISGFRRAFKLRLRTAPGVVTTSDASIGSSLILQNDNITNPASYEGYIELNEYVSRLENEWLSPNGDEIDHAMHKWRWLYELWGGGFYNKLEWPEADIFARRRHISEKEAEDILHRAKEYHKARQEYNKALRGWLTANPRKYRLDTPFLVGRSMALHKSREVGADLYYYWSAYKSLDFKDRPERDSSAVRVCNFKVINAVKCAEKWASKGEGGILWYYNKEIGKWLLEILENNEVACVYCPAGEYYNKQIISISNKDKIIVASIEAHKEGKNLQHFFNQYFVQWPRSAKTAEQVLGRTHRAGQKADELVVYTNKSSEFDDLNFSACLNDSLYIHQSTGNKQKLIIANYNPIPKIYPTAFLFEKGFNDISVLDKNQVKLMEEKFGKFTNKV